ncbi:MAG TPA: hypothetical protein VE990_04845 [Acidimicrobiales bacterium]|nr:hypothetical protein [Acidimicrobiales bacterium]
MEKSHRFGAILTSLATATFITLGTGGPAWGWSNSGGSSQGSDHASQGSGGSGADRSGDHSGQSASSDRDDHGSGSSSAGDQDRHQSAQPSGGGSGSSDHDSARQDQAANGTSTANSSGEDASGGRNAPAGNNGTVKIDEYRPDAGYDNDSHVSCAFSVSFFGFDAGTQNATITLSPQAPTRTGHSVEYQATWTTAQRSGGNQLDANVPIADPIGAMGGQPVKRGYHIKLTAEVTGSQGSDVKHKVFWVTPCSQKPAVMSQASANNQQPSSAQPSRGSRVAGNSEEAAPSAACLTLQTEVVSALRSFIAQNAHPTKVAVLAELGLLWKEFGTQAMTNGCLGSHVLATTATNSGGASATNGPSGTATPNAQALGRSLNAPATGATSTVAAHSGSASPAPSPGTHVLGLTISRPAAATGAGLPAAVAGTATSSGALPVSLPFTGYSAVGGLIWAGGLLGGGTALTLLSRRRRNRR